MKRPVWKYLKFADIERARERLGLTVLAMAELLSVTHSTYHNWKRGDATPTARTQVNVVSRIAQQFAELAPPSMDPGPPLNDEARAAASAMLQSYMRAGGSLEPDEFVLIVKNVMAVTRRYQPNPGRESAPLARRS